MRTEHWHEMYPETLELFENIIGNIKMEFNGEDFVDDALLHNILTQIKLSISPEPNTLRDFQIYFHCT